MADKSFLADLKARMDKAAEDVNDPAIEGIVRVAETQEKSNIALRAMIEQNKTDVVGQIAEVKKEGEAIKSSLAAATGSIAEKIQQIEKLILAGRGYGGAWSAAEKFAAAMPERFKSLIADQARQPSPLPDAVALGCPEGRALTDVWFKLAAQAQLPNRFGRRQNETLTELDKIEQALCEVSTKATYQERTSSQGAYLVPTLVASEIQRLIYDANVLIPLCRQWPMGSDVVNVPTEGAAVTGYWGTELEALTQGEGTIGQTILNAKRLSGYALASIELLTDEVAGLMPYIREVFAEQIARKLEAEMIEGTGTNFTGIITDAGNSVATTTTDGEALVWDDLARAFVAGEERMTYQNSVWLMHPLVFGKSLRMVDSNGQPILLTNRATEAPAWTILGRPVISSSVISVNTTRGATGSTSNIYFGDPKRLLFGTRRGLEWAVSEHVRFANYEVAMRLVGRFGFAVGVPKAWTKLVGVIASG